MGSSPRRFISRYHARRWMKDANDLRRRPFVSTDEVEEDVPEAGGLSGVLQELEILGELVEKLPQDNCAAMLEPKTQHVDNIHTRPGALRRRCAQASNIVQNSDWHS